MAKVFISYVHEDEKVAQAVQGYVANHLDLMGQVFMIADSYRVLAGSDWLDRIRQELSSAKVVILMMSRRSVGRPWVNFEAGAGWIMGKTLIPVCYGTMGKGDLPKPYSNFTALDLPNDKAFLLRSVAAALGLADPSIGALYKILTKDQPTTLESFNTTMRKASDQILDSALSTFRDDIGPL